MLKLRHLTSILVDEGSYILEDSGSEGLYDMNLRTSLERARRRKLFKVWGGCRVVESTLVITLCVSDLHVMYIRTYICICTHVHCTYFT